MNAYIYQADLWCEACTMQIMFDLIQEALKKTGIPFEDFSAQGDFWMVNVPRGSSLDQIKEALPGPPWDIEIEQDDKEQEHITLSLTPQDDEHTYDSDDWPKGPDSDGGGKSDSVQNCAGGETCVNATDGHGVFLENPLTSEGYEHLKEMLDGHGETLPPYAKEWAEFYSFTHFKQPYEHAHDWLIEKLTDLTTRMSGVGTEVDTMFEYARDMAGKLDGDQIQDLFQSDMDEDDFFKTSGWYSSEMSE